MCIRDSGEQAKLSLRGGTLPDHLRELATPIEIEIAAAPAKLRIEGTLARSGASPETAPGFALQFQIKALFLASWCVNRYLDMVVFFQHIYGNCRISACLLYTSRCV